MQQDLAQTFDKAAELYDSVRPRYPQELFEYLKRTTRLSREHSVLEVGCGTGQATIDLLKLTQQITLVDPGEHLLRISQQKFRDLTCVVAKFEDYETTQKFDLIVSATAWHWLDSKVRNQKSYHLLNAYGKLAILYHYHIETDPNSFHSQADHIYAKYLGGVRDLSSRDQIMERKHELNNAYFYLIDLVEVTWQQVYSVDRYLQLRNTYSDHISLKKETREAFENELRNLADKEFGGQITKSYTSVLFLAGKNKI